MQVLNNILNVVNQLLGSPTTEVLGSTQIQKASSSRMLKVLDNFVRVVGSIDENQTNKTLDLRELKVELPNIAFNINRDLFVRDVFFGATRKKGIVSVSITTDKKLAEITSETLSVIKIPKVTFMENPETLYSFSFTEPSLFLTEGQLRNINGNKTQIDQVVDSNVLSASILARKIEKLEIPIVLIFKKLEQQKVDGSIESVSLIGKWSCFFWNLFCLNAHISRSTKETV